MITIENEIGLAFIRKQWQHALGSIIARYVDGNGIPEERLVDLRDINDKTGDGQAKAILTLLGGQGLDSDKIVFLSYDYTSSMSGKFKGCQAKMKEYLSREIP